MKSIETFRAEMGIQENGSIHLNNAGVAPLSGAACRLLSEYHESISQHGIFLQEKDWFQEFEKARIDIARFLNCQKEEISFLSSCAAALSQAAFAFDLPKGTKIVSFEEEYPSNAYPWIALSRQNEMTLQRIAFEDFGRLEEEALLEAIDAETSIVAVSWVQFQNGATCDLKKISRRCREVSAKFVVDGIQGVGVIPFDWQSVDIDVLCLGTHKWMCAPLGMGIMVSKRDLIGQMKPLSHGALNYGELNEAVFLDREPLLDSRRFEAGSPPLGMVLATSASLNFLDSFALQNVHQKAFSLSELLRDSLEERGHQVYRPNRGKEYLSSPIVTFVPSMGIERASELLSDHRVSFAQRLDGIRLSPHAFNTEEEIRRVSELFNN